MSELHQLIDHAAELQRDVDQLRAELLALALVAVALTVTLTILEAKAWHG